MTTSSDSSQNDVENLWWLVIWVLLVIGILLVWFAEPIGINLVKERYSSNSNSYQWSSDKARTTALAIQCVGAMIFAAGLVERLALQIARLKT